MPLPSRRSAPKKAAPIQSEFPRTLWEALAREAIARASEAHWPSPQAHCCNGPGDLKGALGVASWAVRRCRAGAGPWGVGAAVLEDLRQALRDLAERRLQSLMEFLAAGPVPEFLAREALELLEWAREAGARPATIAAVRCRATGFCDAWLWWFSGPLSTVALHADGKLGVAADVNMAFVRCRCAGQVVDVIKFAQACGSSAPTAEEALARARNVFERDLVALAMRSWEGFDELLVAAEHVGTSAAVVAEARLFHVVLVDAALRAIGSFGSVAPSRRQRCPLYTTGVILRAVEDAGRAGVRQAAVTESRRLWESGPHEDEGASDASSTTTDARAVARAALRFAGASPAALALAKKLAASVVARGGSPVEAVGDAAQRFELITPKADSLTSRSWDSESVKSGPEDPGKESGRQRSIDELNSVMRAFLLHSQGAEAAERGQSLPEAVLQAERAGVEPEAMNVLWRRATALWLREFFSGRFRTFALKGSIVADITGRMVTDLGNMEMADNDTFWQHCAQAWEEGYGS